MRARRFVMMCVHWMWVCACVCALREHVPVEVTARSQNRELHPSSSLQSALSAVSSSCYGSSSEGCIHGRRRKLASPNNRPPTPPLPVSPRQDSDPLVNLPGGQRSMAQSCRVTVRDDERENEKERSYTTQMGRRDEKMKRWDQIWLLSRGGGAVGHSAVYKMAAVLSVKWRWNVDFCGLFSLDSLSSASGFVHFCLCLRVFAELRGVQGQGTRERHRPLETEMKGGVLSHFPFFVNWFCVLCVCVCVCFLHPQCFSPRLRTSRLENIKVCLKGVICV